MPSLRERAEISGKEEGNDGNKQGYEQCFFCVRRRRTHFLAFLSVNATVVYTQGIGFSNRYKYSILNV